MNDPKYGDTGARASRRVVLPFPGSVNLEPDWPVISEWARDVHYHADVPHWMLEEWPDGAVGVAVGSQFHPVGELALRRLGSLVETVFGPPVYPAYSIVTEFRTGQRIGRHFDQNPWSEMVAGIMLDLEGTESWPLRYQDGQEVRNIPMRAGDGYAMSGHEIEHWRDPLEAERAVVLCLRYTSDREKWWGGRSAAEVEAALERGRRILDRYGNSQQQRGTHENHTP